MSEFRSKPAAGQSCDHFVHKSGQVVDRSSTDCILAHDQAGAEGVQNTIEVAADQTSRRVESPCSDICSAEHL